MTAAAHYICVLPRKIKPCKNKSKVEKNTWEIPFYPRDYHCGNPKANLFLDLISHLRFKLSLFLLSSTVSLQKGKLLKQLFDIYRIELMTINWSF